MDRHYCVQRVLLGGKVSVFNLLAFRISDVETLHAQVLSHIRLLRTFRFFLIFDLISLILSNLASPLPHFKHAFTSLLSYTLLPCFLHAFSSFHFYIYFFPFSI